MRTESDASAPRLQWVRPELIVIVGADEARNQPGVGADGGISAFFISPP
jgi:hypothetical protein